MPLRHVGLFGTSRDLAPAAQSISDLAQDEPHQHEANLIAYLRGATMVMPWMETTVDVVGGTFQSDGGSALMSDGLWVWRWDLADYLMAYHVELPPEFVAHCESKGFQPDRMTDADVSAVELELMGS